MSCHKFTELTHRVLAKHKDPCTLAYEIVLLGYCDNQTASEHLSRYVLASKLAYGIVLDCAAGSCYGSSILRRSKAVTSVISVDVSRDVLEYGKTVYNADCVCADATYLPFRGGSFDSIVTIETLEHIKSKRGFLNALNYVLKKRGHLILSTPNKLYTSPFLPKTMNPYHANEYYLGPLLMLLESEDFKVSRILGGGKVTILKLIRRILHSFPRFSLGKFSIKPYLVDNLSHSISNMVSPKKQEVETLIDPDPKLFPHVELRASSNIIPYEYFVIYAYKS